MKTITLKFVVDDDDLESANNIINQALEGDLSGLAASHWSDRKATKKEIEDHRAAEGLKINCRDS